MLDSPVATGSGTGFIYENVNKILSTFVPAHYRRESNQLLLSIGVKSHGTITFSDNKSNRAEFIRIPPDAPVMEVKHLLNRQQCNERPSLVISVTGGAKDYNMKPKLLRAFRRGLLKVARTTGAWIITGGMNTGIMKLVGEIVQINPDRSRPIHLIGIATWGCVSGFQQLDVHGTTVQYTKPRREQRGEAPIEPNHTEFIFIDDGTERQYGREIAFRARLERAISGDFFGSRATATPSPLLSLSERPPIFTEQTIREEMFNNSFDLLTDPVPVVLLVVEGGPNTVRTVHEAVVQNNIPAVFFEGTGRCCDLFAKAYRLYNEYRRKFELFDDTSSLDPDIVSSRYVELKNKLREELKVELREISGAGDGNNSKAPRKIGKKERPSDTTDYFQLVYQCINTRINFLNVVSLDSRNPVEPDIDLAILHALLNATSGVDSTKTSSQRKREQFRLALQWNRVDIARNYIMKDVRDWERIDLNDMFELALSRNQSEFVKLFLEHDFSVTDVFRNTKVLPSLYLCSMKEIPVITSLPHDSLKIIYKDIIQPFIGDFFEVEAASSSQALCSHTQLDLDNAGCSCCTRRKRNTNVNVEPDVERADSFHSKSGPTACGDSLLDVDKELFVWSVITGRRDFNLLFWARGKNKICAALFAALIYRERALKDNDNSYYQSADEFEKLAVDILDRFHQANAPACSKAIIRQIPAYGNVTWLELAIKAEAKEFIAQRAVQDVLNNIWYGYIDHRESHKTIVFSTIMIWYSGFLRYHDELVKTAEQMTFLDELFGKSKLLQQNQTIKVKYKNESQGNDVHMRLIHRASRMDNTPVKFVPVGCCEKTKVGITRYFGNIIRFIRAPYVKFLYNLYFHLIFLLLFSYVLLCDFYPLYEFQLNTCRPAISPSAVNADQESKYDDVSNDDLSVSKEYRIHDGPAIKELILAVWIFSLLCEEVRQFFSSEAHTLRKKAAAYFGVFWNILDIIAILVYCIGFALRFIPAKDCFCAARIVLSVDLAMWFLRLLDIFAAVKQLGPKLVMIGEMAHDLKVYVLMLTVFVLGYGVAAYSLLYGSKEFDWHILREILNLAYWEIFGDLNALEAFGNNFKANAYAVFVLLVIYMAIVSILLVNLLIAMFSNTFNRLQTNTDRIWKFQRYSLICEYLSRPSLPPPFILFTHLWRFTLYALTRCSKSSWLKVKYDQHTSRTKYKISVDEKYASNIEAAEDALGDEVYYNYLKFGRKLVDKPENDEERVQSPQEIMLNKIRTLEDRMQIMNNQQAHVFEYLDSIMAGLRLMGGDQIKVPERRHFDPDELFDEPTHTIDQLGNRRGLRLEDVSRQPSTQSDEIHLSKLDPVPTRGT